MLHSPFSPHKTSGSNAGQISFAIISTFLAVYKILRFRNIPSYFWLTDWRRNFTLVKKDEEAAKFKCVVLVQVRGEAKHIGHSIHHLFSISASRKHSCVNSLCLHVHFHSYSNIIKRHHFSHSLKKNQCLCCDKFLSINLINDDSAVSFEK